MVEALEDDASALHLRRPPAPMQPTVWLCRPTRSAMVLGSAQAPMPDESRARALGLEVVRRRSGGGAVVVVPGELVWIDVLVPRGDPVWSDDVGRAFHWLGELWCEALGDLSIAGRAHTGALVRTERSPMVCFAGIGPGEVLVHERLGGPEKKVVGISQRRDRSGARFQCAALLAWDPDPYVDLLFDGDPAVRSELGEVAAGLGVEAAALESALLGRLATR